MAREFAVASKQRQRAAVDTLPSPNLGLSSLPQKINTT